MSGRPDAMDRVGTDARMALATIAAMAIVVMRPVVAHASPSAAGPEFPVNTYTTSVQTGGHVAVEPDGDFVVVWESLDQDGHLFGVYGQRFDGNGAPLGGEFQVNTVNADDQFGAEVAVDADGDFVVVWQSAGSLGSDTSGTSVQARRYDSFGNPMGREFQVNSYVDGDQGSPAVSMEATGDFVVVWHSPSQDGNGYGVYGQRYSATGIPLDVEFQVNAFHTADQFGPDVALDRDGDFVVAYETETSPGSDASGTSINARRYDASGIPQDVEFQVNTYTPSMQRAPAVALDADGDFTVVWESAFQDGDDMGVYGQQFSAAGVPQGAEFQVNTLNASAQQGPDVAVDADGNFVITWESFGSRGSDGSESSIQARRYGFSGIADGLEFQVNTSTPGDQVGSAVAIEPTGDFVVIWNSDEALMPFGGDVLGQRFAVPSHNPDPPDPTCDNTPNATEAPINSDGSSNFRLGRTIPVKVRVLDCAGHPVDTLAPQVALTKVGGGNGPVNEVVSTSSADSGMTMRSIGDGYYQFNLSTKRSQFNDDQDLTEGRYQLMLSEASFASPVIVGFDLRS